MSTPQTPPPSPEPDEPQEPQEAPTDRLARAVRAAETALIEYEIAVETFRIEVENFSRLHHQRLGPVYHRLDELDALIAEAVAARSGDPADAEAAAAARAAVAPMPGLDDLLGGWVQSDGMSPEALAMLNDQAVRPPKRVRPSEEARRIYRELVRKAHPDLSTDPTERARREEFVVRANRAYADGDEAELTRLAEEWAAGPRPEPDLLSRAEELYARLEWLAQRKEWLTRQVKEVEESAVGSMLKLAADDPDGLLEEIAEQLAEQVRTREAQLADLTAEPASASPDAAADDAADDAEQDRTASAATTATAAARADADERA